MTIKGFKSVNRRLKSTLNKARPALLNEIGKTAVRRIKGGTRSPKDRMSNQKIPELKDTTIEHRRYLQRFNRTHSTFSPRRSNLTITGQLIDAVTYSKKSNQVEIFVKDSARKKYKTGGDGGTHRPPTNQELSQFLSKKGFKFMRIGKSAREQIENKINRELRRKLRREFMR
jgi:hypothetical protein